MGVPALDAMNEILPDFSGDLCHGVSRKAAHRRKTGADISHPKPYTANMLKAVISQALFFDVRSRRS